MILRRKLFPLNFAVAEGDPPAAGGGSASGEIRGACPCCQSPIFVEGGVVKGGGTSEFFQSLKTKADSADDWRNKCAALQAEQPPAPAPAPAPAPPAAEEGESFF